MNGLQKQLALVYSLPKISAACIVCQHMSDINHYTFTNRKYLSVKTQYIQQRKVCHVFLLQVTIIRQTFQYMDMTCSVPQCGITFRLHLLCRITNVYIIKLLSILISWLTYYLKLPMNL
jgi:hypothetical protein